MTPWRSSCSAELIFRRGTPPDAEYTFKHALVQDAAYSTLLRARAAAAWPHRRDAGRPVPRGRHCPARGSCPALCGGRAAEKAVAYWLKAGQQALERSAYLEAINHLARGLEAAQASPDSTERVQRELELQLALGSALMATKGYAAPEVE